MPRPSLSVTSLNSSTIVSMIAPSTSSMESSGICATIASAASCGLSLTNSSEVLNALTKRRATSGRSPRNLSDASSEAE